MNPLVVAAIIAAGVSVLTLVGTLLVQIYGIGRTKADTAENLRAQFAEQRQQLDKTLNEQRTQALNERFATAAAMLGDDRPTAVRLAGAYAMAGLADDWPGNRQACVDVLCGFLRLPHLAEPGDSATSGDQLAFRASREVRHTVIREITRHLRKGAPTSWEGLSFDFTGAVFDGGDFSGAVFSGGTATFRDAVFASGHVSFRDAVVTGGTVDFFGATFSGAEVNFSHAVFSGGEVSFVDAIFSGGKVWFINSKFYGAEVSFLGAHFSGAKLDFGSASFTRGTINLCATYSGSDVDFAMASLGTVIRVDHALFSAGMISFDYTDFDGSTTKFGGAVFKGATLDFRKAINLPPQGFCEPPPAGVKLPSGHAPEPTSDRNPSA